MVSRWGIEANTEAGAARIANTVALNGSRNSAHAAQTLIVCIAEVIWLRPKAAPRYFGIVLLLRARFGYTDAQQTLPRVIGEMPYMLTMRGSSVVDIEPRGVGYPLFENQPTGKLVQRSRFVPRIDSIIW